MIHPDRYHLPEGPLAGRPRLATLREDGLPTSIRWSFDPSAPEYSFDFGPLAQGGVEYETDDLARADPYFPPIHEMRIIGSYRYTFLDLRRQSDVCISLADGSLWIVDLQTPSIIDRPSALDNEPTYERIPLSYQYLNSRSDRFERCIRRYLDDIERFPRPETEETTVIEGWTRFEEFVRQTDPQALEHETAFWPCIIGERLGPF